MTLFSIIGVVHQWLAAGTLATPLTLNVPLSFVLAFALTLARHNHKQFARRRRDTDCEWAVHRELKGLDAITLGDVRLVRTRRRCAGWSEAARPAAGVTAGRADAGRGARTLCLIKFIRENKTVSRDCASRRGAGRAGREDWPGRQLRRICRFR